MDQNSVKVSVNVSDDGTTAKTAQNVTKLKDLLKEISSVAAAASKSIGSMAAGTGGSVTTGKLKKATEGSEAKDYGAARASMGTGAAGRDFAKESQGLGGLVRLYATYAANVYAAGAAFRALSEAMNTTNMVQGLNQLGAASGVAMGSLAKQFSQASGGAISMRESMEAAGKAISSGLSPDQFLQIGEVAKKASQALGISMSDAVSRLTRGITKLEPELLDELAIFTKLDKSTADYARTLGKGAAALTDFERRQGFAVAVLAEGNKKFSEISIPVNPYDKLLASLVNLGQKILEIVNKGLSPLVNLLSESPTALTSLIALLAATIVKQALPALGQYRQGLKDAADANLLRAQERAKEAGAALAIVKAANAAEIKAEKDRIAVIKIARVDELQNKLQSIAKQGELTKRAQNILRTDRNIIDITDKQLKYLEDQSKKNITLADTYKQLAAAIAEAKKANLDYIAASARLDKEMGKRPGKYTPAGIALDKAEKAERVSTSSTLISQAGETTAIKGFGAAISELSTGISKGKLGTVRGVFTGIAGGINAAVTAVGGLLSAFSNFFSYIGIAVVAYGLLDSAFRSNAKELKALEDATDSLAESTKNAIAVGKKYGSIISVDSVIASSNALGTLSQDLAKQADAFLAAEAAGGLWSKTIDKILSITPFVKSTGEKFADTFAGGVLEAINRVSDPALKKQLDTNLKKLLKTEGLSLPELISAVKSATDENIKAVAVLVKGASTAQKAVADPLQASKEGFDKLSKSYADLANSLINTDPLTKFSLDLTEQTSNLAKSFADPISRVAELKGILEDTSKIKMFPPESQALILDAARNIGKAYNDAATSMSNIMLAQDKIAAAKKLEDIPGMDKGVTLRLKMEGEELLASATEVHRQSTAKLSQINVNLTKGLKIAAEGAFKSLEAPLTRAMAQSSINTQKTLLSFLPKTPESVALNTKLDIQAIEIRKDEISALFKLTEAIDRKRLQDELQILEAKKAKETPSSMMTETDIKIQKVQEQIKAYDTGVSKRPGGAASGLAMKEVSQIYATRMGYLSKLQALTNEQQMKEITGYVDEIIAAFAKTRRDTETELKQIQTENAAYYSSDAFRNLAPGDKALEEAKRVSKEREVSDRLQRSPIMEKIAVSGAVEGKAATMANLENREKIIKLARDAETATRKELSALQEAQEVAGNIADTEANRLSTFEKLSAQLDSEKLVITTSASLYAIQNQEAKDALDLDKQKLDNLNSIGAITQDQYNVDKRILELKQVDLELSGKLFSLQSSYLAQQKDLAKEIADPKNAGNTKALQDQMDANLSIYNADVAAARKSAELKRASIDLTKDMAERTSFYAKTFQDVTSSMSDALVDFAMTGEQKFDRMIKSMILNLIKFETQMMLTKAVASAGGFSGIVSSIFGAIFGTTDTTTVGTPSWNAAHARGAAFDSSGIQAFAQGGAFTNTIVSKPTTFAFSKGTGLMGEAGPEAIMPLKRAADGSLGVRSAGGNNATKVDVVVNNYSKEQATTKETVDSRGNRRVEVQIGEMVAGEMQRPNSPMQGAMRNTYGVTPMMTRR